MLRVQSVSLALALSVEAAAAEPVIWLDQAWSQEDREWYYQFSQGSTVLSYDVFLNLEVAGGRELFRSDANSDRYGLIPQAPNPRTNPDGLPIGLAKTMVTEILRPGDELGAQVGLTCAACHNAQLEYEGHRVRIDGGVANTFDLMSYVGALDDALQETLADAAKFDRLAARLAEDPDVLRRRLEIQADQVHEYRTRNLVTPTAWGPSRMDAIALIANRLLDTLPGIPENWSAPVAPTKPPFLWNAPQGLWTQWRGSQQDPIQRNLTETMGVFMSIDLHSETPEEGLFRSNAAIEELGRAEELLSRLAPPKWPEEVFGPIDRDLAREGEALFVTHCSACHNAWPYTWSEPNAYGKQFVLVGLIPQSYVGTDPGQFENLRPVVITSQLAPYLPEPYEGLETAPTGVVFEMLRLRILGSALDELDLSEEEAIALHGYRELPIPSPPEGVYKAAPRDGVWATPPFLHNGSVPNLYELLLPAAERSETFWLGREFDPVRVGLDTTETPDAFLFDTSLLGNSNAGHSFEDGPLGNGIIGPLLTDDQRWALVEYLKSIPDTAGRVTPFGGPPAP